MPRLELLFFGVLWGCASDIKIAPKVDTSNPWYGLDVQPRSWQVETELGDVQQQRFTLIANEKVEVLTIDLQESLDTGTGSPWSLDFILEPPVVLTAGSELSMTVSFAPAETTAWAGVSRVGFDAG